MLSTSITKLFNVKHPVLLAGMGGAAGPEIAAAVTNAGGLGSIGGIEMSPDAMRKTITMLKEDLIDKNAPFGVDLLLPQIGGNARKTNYDYTHGNLEQLIDVIIECGAKLFICAVGVPPTWVVDKLHAAGIPVMNMIGAVKHVEKALAAGVDIICAQGGEGGGHTGDIATSILIPKVVDACKNRMSPLTKEQVPVVAAGGIFDGRGLAAALSMGASGVWVGTRFVACEEAAAGPYHKNLIKKCGYSDTVRSLIYTGRPMRVNATPFVKEWETTRKAEAEAKLAIGEVPVGYHLEYVPPPYEAKVQDRPYLMGQAAGAIEDVKPAKEIVEEMVSQAHQLLLDASKMLSVPQARL